MRAMPAVNIDRSIIADCPAGVIYTAPVINCNDPARGNIYISRCCGSTAQSGVGYGNDLGRAVIAKRISAGCSHNTACASFVVFLVQEQVFNPGYIQNPGDVIQLGGIGSHQD